MKWIWFHLFNKQLIVYKFQVWKPIFVSPGGIVPVITAVSNLIKVNRTDAGTNWSLINLSETECLARSAYITV